MWARSWRSTICVSARLDSLLATNVADRPVLSRSERVVGFVVVVYLIHSVVGKFGNRFESDSSEHLSFLKVHMHNCLDSENIL